jgi:hypothetical protein
MLIRLLLALLIGVGVGTAQATTFYDTDWETCAVGSGNDFPCEGWTDRGFAHDGSNPEFINQPGYHKMEISTDFALTGTKAFKATFVNVILPPMSTSFLVTPCGRARGFRRGRVRRSLGDG